jgi:putative two-component system response regulator
MAGAGALRPRLARGRGAEDRKGRAMGSSNIRQPLHQSVLLIEDEAPTRNVVARHLRNSGYEVTAVESAEDALAEVDARPDSFDVVISDVHLPGVSGIDLASVLLIRNPTQPIVLVTGDPDEALARDALSRGPVSYLLKPFELFELDAAVQQAIVRSQPLAVTAARTRERWQGEAGSALDDWLQFVDDHSYAGKGHADRVARMATMLLDALSDAAPDIGADEIVLAARAHEIGRLEGPTADPIELAVQGAALLADANLPAVVARTVRHLHERWDGTGGPDGLAGSSIPSGSLVLAAADSIDHYCSAWMQAGIKPLDAVDRAIGLVVIQQSTMFSPLVAGAVHRHRAEIREICTAARAVPARSNPAADLSAHRATSARVRLS